MTHANNRTSQHQKHNHESNSKKTKMVYFLAHINSDNALMVHK